LVFVWNLEFGIWNLEFGIWNLEFGIKTLLVILGPTASGKTDLAIKVAGWLGTEIISADSRQFYRELSIGTARPTADQLAAVKHHFIGHISIHDRYNISRFEQDSLKLLEELFRKHDVVVMCGGSGLYIDAVCNGIDEQPDHDPAIRKLLTDKFKEQGIGYLQAELFILDPEYYRQVDISNPNRLIRALEVCMLTGRPFSSFLKATRKKRDFKVIKLGIDIPRNELIERINLRVDHMIENGLEQEAREHIGDRHLNALNTVGYKELFEYFDDKCSLSEAIDKIKTNTRRYAKRQMTWFRKDKEINWINAGDELELKERIELLNG
jgi:tRNA dimethylallyltransferase